MFQPNKFNQMHAINLFCSLIHGKCTKYQTCAICFKVCTFHAVVKQTFELRHEISNSVECATSKGSDQPAHTHSLIRAFASRLNIL